MSLSRTFFFAALSCYVGLAPCLAPAREYRSSTVKHEFQRLHPCPSTGRTTDTCPGYVKDHIRALDCGGPDSVANAMADRRGRESQGQVGAERLRSLAPPISSC